MKRFFSLLVPFAICIILAACSGKTESSIPDLTGNWVTKSISYHHEERGFIPLFEQTDGKWVIKEQKGQVFWGERVYTKIKHDNSVITESFSGVIARDGKRVYIVDHIQDKIFGEVLTDGTIELVMMNDGDVNGHSQISLMVIARDK